MKNLLRLIGSLIPTSCILCNRLAVEMPITTTVSEVLLGKQTLTVALQGLMGRDAKSEH